MLLLTESSAFRFGRRRQSSQQLCSWRSHYYMSVVLHFWVCMRVSVWICRQLEYLRSQLEESRSQLSQITGQAGSSAVIHR